MPSTRRSATKPSQALSLSSVVLYCTVLPCLLAFRYPHIHPSLAYISKQRLKLPHPLENYSVRF
ncbi:hypothetical protein DL95DRAFT_193402 [Leptodontidium sp. 2 PMI_412]|nr:hypothetical protein DL95DRAFT_193402 [Leptodontidium sp. 2 PMI_412]